MTAAQAERTGAKPPGKAFLAAVSEVVFLTDVYRYSEADALRQLGCSERTFIRYTSWLRDHPEYRLEVLAIYDGDGEVIE